MGRHEVRVAVRDWFGAGDVVGLNTVRLSKPRDWAAKDFYTTGDFGAAGYVYVERTTESQVAVLGPNMGKKRVDHEVGLVFLFKSKQRDSEKAIEDYDQLVESLKTRLRSDPTLGAKVWQAGKRLLEDLNDVPQYDGQAQQIWGVMRFDVTEWVTA